MKPPVAIKRVGQEDTGLASSQSTSTRLMQHKAKSLFLAHFIGTLWRPAVSHGPEAHYQRLEFGHNDIEAQFDALIQVGYDYALEQCLQDPYMKHSGAINEDQTNWFKAFGRRMDGMLAINPLDKILEYDKYFGKNIAPERIIYSECIPSGNVLCFSWLKNNYMHVEIGDNNTIDAWMHYKTQADTTKLDSSADDVYNISLDENNDDDDDICDSMLVNIRGLSGESIIDRLIDGLI